MRSSLLRDKRGMTLIEVLLALALFALLSLFLTQTMSSVIGIWQAGETRGRGDLTWATAAERFRSDVDALHTGRSGTLVLDSWEARPATDLRPAWRLPRLRFVARGAGLPFDDPTGRLAFEIAWVFAPESQQSGRLMRLLRFAQPTDPNSPDLSLFSDRHLEGLVRTGQGMTILDGVAWGRFSAEGLDGRAVDSLTIEPRMPYSFPAWLDFDLERVDVGARKRPIELDEQIAGSAGTVVLRGKNPSAEPNRVLIDQEWVTLAGTWPSFRAIARGERGTLAEAHERGSLVWVPDTFQSRFYLPILGRRIMR